MLACASCTRIKQLNYVSSQSYVLCVFAIEEWRRPTASSQEMPGTFGGGVDIFAFAETHNKRPNNIIIRSDNKDKFM